MTDFKLENVMRIPEWDEAVKKIMEETTPLSEEFCSKVMEDSSLFRLPKEAFKNHSDNTDGYKIYFYNN